MDVRGRELARRFAGHPKSRVTIGMTCRAKIAALLLLVPTLASAHTDPSPDIEQINAETRAQRVFTTQQYLSDLIRLERVAHSVLQAASPYCVQNRKYSIGASPVSVTDLPEDLRRGFVELQGSAFSAFPRFLHVLPVSPSGEAGIKSGDQLLSMIDEATGAAISPGWTLRRPASTLTQNAPLTLVLGNGNEKRTLEVRPQLICDEWPRLVRQDDLVARVTAGTMIVSTGLLRFIRNDDELAILLSNELAHSILSSATGVAKFRHPSRRYSAEQERAADYLGTYIAVLGGFNAERSKDIWRRVASNLPSTINDGLAQAHPFSPERALWQRATLAEIRRKNLLGQRLAPDRKSLPDGTGLEIAAADAPYVASADTSTEGVDPRLTRIADVPFVGNSGRSGYQRFLDTPLRPRAFAVSPGAGVWAYRTGVDAAAAALAACTRPFAPCYLYAVDDRVVWNPETAMLTPHPSTIGIDAPRINRVSEVPFLDNDGRIGYERFLSLTVRPRAFAIGPNSNGSAAWAFKNGPNASADALAYCAVLTRGRPCYLYAVDDDVVWNMENAPISLASPQEIATATSALRHPPASGFADVDDLASVPLSPQQLTVYRAFLEKPAPRAFVISQEGFGRYWLGTAAMENALAYCERLGEPCWLYAVDNDVVWQEERAKRLSKRVQLPKQSEETQFLK